MDINDIRKRRALINRQISKGFNDNFSQENISKAYDDEFNKAHKVGDIHPNGKWVWTEIKPGKFDWRVIKKTKGSTSNSKVSPTVAAKVKVGNTAVNGVKSQAKTNIQNQGYGFILDESGNKIPLTLEVAEAVYKRWSNSVPVNTGKGKFPWRPSAVPSPKMKNDGLDFRTADGCKADIADRAAAAKRLVDKIKADQAAKTPMQKNVDKQLLDSGFSVTGKNSKGDTIYHITDPDDTNLPDEFRQGYLPEITVHKNGSIYVDIYKRSKLNYIDKVASFGYGRLRFNSNNPNVIDLAKKLTSLIVYGDQDNFNCEYNESTENFEVSVKLRGGNDFKHIGSIWVQPKYETVEYIPIIGNPFNVFGVAPRFNKFSDLQKFLSHYSSLYAECKYAQDDVETAVETAKKLVAKKQADMDAKRQKFQNFLRQQ